MFADEYSGFPELRQSAAVVEVIVNSLAERGERTIAAVLDKFAWDVAQELKRLQRELKAAKAEESVSTQEAE